MVSVLDLQIIAAGYMDCFGKEMRQVALADAVLAA